MALGIHKQIQFRWRLRQFYGNKHDVDVRCWFIQYFISENKYHCRNRDVGSTEPSLHFFDLPNKKANGDKLILISRMNVNPYNSRLSAFILTFERLQKYECPKRNNIKTTISSDALVIHYANMLSYSYARSKLRVYMTMFLNRVTWVWWTMALVFFLCADRGLIWLHTSVTIPVTLVLPRRVSYRGSYFLSNINWIANRYCH